MRLERFRADHADALPAFERENRAYFARSIPDREGSPVRVLDLSP